MKRAMLLATLIGALVAAVAAPSSAFADFGIVPGSFTAAALDQDGNPDHRAGGHPDVLRVGYVLNADSGVVDGNLKDTVFEFPPGFVGAPNAVPRCPRDLISMSNPVGCPPESQVGTVTISNQLVSGFVAPIYNVDPAPNALADFGFEAFIVAGHLATVMRPDGGVSTLMQNLEQDAPLLSLSFELWGVPADHQTGTSIPRRPAITMPARCDGVAPTITLKARSWQQPDSWQTVTTQLAQAATGCESQSFDPGLGLELDDATHDTSTGAEIVLDVPQNDDPDGRASRRVKDIDIQLPEDVGLSPSGASALTACSGEAFGLGRDGAAGCPRSSRIGTVEMTSALLDDPISGALYLGAEPAQLFLAIKGSGIDFKAEGALLIDPSSGRITTRLTNLPDLPFDQLAIRFGGGLATPLHCGDATATATLTPYGGGPPVTSSDLVTVAADGAGAPCPPTLPFAPTFVAGTFPATAGAPARMSMEIGRRDGDQLLGGFRATLPPGLGARLGSVRRCPSASVAANACTQTSRIGSAVAQAGPGTTPLALEGDMFLTGPYRDAPFGLSIVFPARLGPFDLGSIAVRAALGLDPRSGQVTIDSDAVPSSVLGMPLRIQNLAIDIDRPGFLFNPTSCAPAQVGAEIASTGGATARASSRFAVRGCRKLGFEPVASMALTNPSSLYDGGHPGLSMRIRPGNGANVRAVDVGLPRTLGLALDQIGAICAPADAELHRCPKGARVGRAVAHTALLPKPLRGGLYIVQRDGALPDLWALLGHGRMALNVPIQTVARDGRLHAKIVGLPDLPLTGLALRFASGDHGIFAATDPPCDGRRPRLSTASLRLTAHNGAQRSLRMPVSAVRGCRARAAASRHGG